MSTTFAIPAELALHILSAVLPRDQQADASQIRLHGVPGLHDAQTAAAFLEKLPKPVECRVRIVEGMLEVQADCVEKMPEEGPNLILEDLLAVASEQGHERILVAGRDGHALLTNIQAWAALERDYRIMARHFVQVSPPTPSQVQVLRVVSYFPSESRTHVVVEHGLP